MNVIGYCSKILKKNEQCSLLVLSTQLYYNKLAVLYLINLE